jgi:hypothetical protein
MQHPQHQSNWSAVAKAAQRSTFNFQQFSNFKQMFKDADPSKASTQSLKM